MTLTLATLGLSGPQGPQPPSDTSTPYNPDGVTTLVVDHKLYRRMYQKRFGFLRVEIAIYYLYYGCVVDYLSTFCEIICLTICYLCMQLQCFCIKCSMISNVLII